jgi:hypothetical protein
MQRRAWEQGVAAEALLELGETELVYREPADRMRAAVHAKVDRCGLVQGVCGAPNFNRPGTATEGQAFLLLMEAAQRDLRG